MCLLDSPGAQLLLVVLANLASLTLIVFLYGVAFPSVGSISLFRKVASIALFSLVILVLSLDVLLLVRAGRR